MQIVVSVLGVAIMVAAATTITWYRSVECRGPEPAGLKTGVCWGRGMRLFGTIMLVLVALAGPAWADEPDECRVAEHLVQNPFPLPRVTKALEAKRLDILVLGGGSSMLPGASGNRRLIHRSYRMRLRKNCPTSPSR